MNSDRLRTYCLSLPGATEGIKWEEHIAYMVGEKIFCMTGFTDDTHVTFKVDPDDFAELTERDGVEQAAHWAKGQWISIHRRNKLSPKEWEEYIQRSYKMVKAKLTKKMQKEIDEMQP